ncbi:MAG TPA: hypothetical protein VGC92_01890, partial [Phenylobacterium sp.]
MATSMPSDPLVGNGPEHTLPAGLADWLRDRGLLWAGSGSSAWASLAAVSAGLLVGALCGACNGLVIT